MKILHGKIIIKMYMKINKTCNKKKTSQVKKKKKCIENVHEDKLIVKISCEKNRKNNVKINES